MTAPMRRALFGIVIALALGISSARPAQNSGSPDLEKFSGVYEVLPGQFAYVQPWPGGGKLLYTDEAGQLRTLSPVSRNVFSAGPALLVATPIDFRIAFTENPQHEIIGLVRRQEGFPDRHAKRRTEFARQEVRFDNGDVSLAGTLHLPPGPGPHAAIVLIHGTGRTDRNTVLPIVHFLVTKGVALLGYDKRGVGGSSGDWRAASLDDLAGDAAAAVRFLRNRRDIDPKKIGLFAVSQGGWIAPLALSKSPEIAFLISVSGPAVSPAQVESDRLSGELRTRGFSESDIREAVELLRLGNEVAQGRESWATFQAASEKKRTAKWFPYASLPPAADSWLFDHWRRLPFDYDPSPAIAKVHVPVLALFGGLDRTVLPSRNAQQWRDILQAVGNKDHAIQVFATANHMLLEAKTRADESAKLQRFVPEYASTLVNWLRQRGFAQ